MIRSEELGFLIISFTSSYRKVYQTLSKNSEALTKIQQFGKGRPPLSAGTSGMGLRNDITRTF